MTIRESLESVLYQALKAAVEAGELPLNEIPQPSLERPREEGHGDWACTIAMRLAKAAHMNPRAIAQAIVDHLPENNLVESFEIAGPGFINLTLTNASFQAVVSEARQQGSDFGKSELSEPCKVNLEYVSANPTGPMHVGHGRWAALGDAIARVMRHAGYSVDEEFYINDQGNQMNVFGNSVVVRYQQLLGQDVEMPEACYGGAYIKDIAQAIIDADGDKWLDANEDERLVAFRERGYAMMLDSVKDTLSTFGNNFDTWFSERSLFVADENGETKQQRAFDVMNEKGLLFEAEGATFFRSTDYGDDKDRVLVKANGDLTYFMSDVAYHYDKMQRGYDHLIDIWGADHHGYIQRCKAMMTAWGYPDALEVVLGQLVNLLRDGEPVRMSKRTGEMVTFQELIDEVGVDATRYLMLSKSADQAIDFDIEVAKKQDSSNPVYYVQYAHARICSILRKAGEARGMNVESAGIEEIVAELGLDDIDLSPLAHESELALMRKMADFSDLVAGAARDRAPFRLTHYAQELAGLFHSFYGNCHVLGEEESVEKARLALVDSTRIVLALSLDLLGVSAPERM
ncbi:MAG: arginine--tRNA ligase [Eggerthellaceae bacterium]|jgi:arginyl-tRNA synthetase|nr:arginine--tRNA ligase [Eggerthellaceae bacterium]MEE0245283.1 arginine--tRNA ligase [Eggerthellaceae bacterium]